jgi:hypothetical protein
MTCAPQARPMRFVTMESGCIVALSHAPNKGGYLSKKWRTGGMRISEPFHRFVYRAHNGEDSIPEGWEIDHLCRNRLCCEPRHLQALSREAHLYLTNRTRNTDRNEAARMEWEARGRCRPAVLAAATAIPATTCRRWIGEWRAE